MGARQVVGLTGICGYFNEKERKMVYQTVGTCSQRIVFDVEGDVVKNVQFVGGCHGNTQGVAALVEGMKVEDVISKLKGIKCGMRPTSCPDQLARALEAAVK